jgi:hypothetical protein
MKATSLINPQTLNLYAYCANDPINRTDPNGLGLISWIKKHWKIILVAVAIVVAILLIPGAPAFLGSFFQHAGQVIISGVGAATEGGGMSTWLKVLLGGAISAGIAGLGTLIQKKSGGLPGSIKDGLKEAEKRLDDPDCAALFGGKEKALAALRAARFSYQNLGAARVNPDDSINVVGAATATNTNPPSVYINSYGPFKNQTILVITPSGVKSQTFDFGSGLRGNDFRALILLHELGHLVGIFGPDANNQALNQEYTNRVKAACFGKK